MLQFKINMGSSVEQVLNFKTCCSLVVQDANLEILVTNTGSSSVEVMSRFDLITAAGVRAFASVFPPGSLRIDPSETKAFYCQMEESVWSEAVELVFRDAGGNGHSVKLERQSR